MERNTQFADFASLVFNDAAMKDRLSPKAFSALIEARENRRDLDLAIADQIAEAMKTWALEKGCTHYCHWFQPLTGSTAEKHDSFVGRGKEGELLLTFSGRSLIKGEPDASSLPSGGLRATFEARGYTYWDTSSPAFIRENVLCIPSVFVSFGGESLDMKRPLLKSIDLIDAKATKLMHLLGYEDVRSMKPMIGLEQEYFLVDRPLWKQREDLRFAKRALIGAMGPKGQELDDHYFGAISVRVANFMRELNEELWKLGIFAQCEHNEVAPGQFELAVLYDECNIAVDQNQVVMDILGRVAYHHGYACLLHEKPFAGCNGSGKHDNYSLVSDSGINVFSPGKSEKDRQRFLLFISAFVKAVDSYPELLRLSVATPGNDHRLGASEAPPAIISVYLGEYFENMLKDYLHESEDGKSARMTRHEVRGFGNLSFEESDRNRTSPMAFTGNKFEFRMLGSSESGAFPNIVLNTILSEVIDEIIEKLEKAEDKEAVVREIIGENIHQHQRILFSGDGYSEGWVKEAQRRGLPNIRSHAQAIEGFSLKKNIDLLEKYGIFSKTELEARQQVMWEQYNAVMGVEVKTLNQMLNRAVVPAMIRERALLKEDLTLKAVEKRYEKIGALLESLEEKRAELLRIYEELKKDADQRHKANEMFERIHPLLLEIRKDADAFEELCSKDNYPLPTSTELLF